MILLKGHQLKTMHLIAEDYRTKNTAERNSIMQSLIS